MKPKNPNSSNTLPSTLFSGLDFQAEDGAWYGVRLTLRQETLTVMYCNFSDAFDERFDAGDFKNLEEVEEFKKRFRMTSSQLQDSECSKVMEGVAVCASHKFGEDDVRFYDAVIESVQYKEHSYSEEEEECLCSFEVLWQHGPNAGVKTSTGIEDICLIKSWNVEDNPILASFLKASRDKHKSSSHNSGFISDVKDGSFIYDSCGSSVKKKSGLPVSEHQESKSPKQSASAAKASKGRIIDQSDMIGQDTDLGGEAFHSEGLGETGAQHFILIENLEKDLSPMTVIEFIRGQTYIAPQAYIFPSLSTEPYTRGAILLESKENLKKVYHFLDNPDHIIVSSRGRPWVITEKLLRRGTFRATFGSLMPELKDKYRNRSSKLSDKIKVAHLGTEEYNKAKLMRELFMDFAEHLQRLHTRLASEEREILKSS